jgi:hypothetical protein
MLPTIILRVWRVILQFLHFQDPPQLPRDLENTYSQHINFTPRSYEDEKLEKGTEPYTRSLGLVYHFSHLKWNIKVTFEGKLRQTGTFAHITKRHQDLENLCLCIDFDFLRPQLLRDTVTELTIICQQDKTIAQDLTLPLKTMPDNESEYAPIANNLIFRIREDPRRVRFPVYNGGSVGTSSLSEIEKIQELSTGVYKAHVRSGERLYVYKEIDRPMYEPRDSEVIEQELRNLTLLRGMEGFVQLISPVVSKNPYQSEETAGDDGQIVLRGILTEYHPNGTLRQALQISKEGLPWYRWAVQITGALCHLHELGITHMDLKPANIVLSENFDAILIDLSGIGGTTHEWLSPEMVLFSEPLSQDIESRKQNDVWALGKLILAIADVTCDETEKQMLMRISAHATAELSSRIPLGEAFRCLSSFPSQN